MVRASHTYRSSESNIVIEQQKSRQLARHSLSASTQIQDYSLVISEDEIKEVIYVAVKKSNKCHMHV